RVFLDPLVRTECGAGLCARFVCPVLRGRGLIRLLNFSLEPALSLALLLLFSVGKGCVLVRLVGFLGFAPVLVLLLVPRPLNGSNILFRGLAPLLVFELALGFVLARPLFVVVLPLEYEVSTAV